MVYSPGTVAPSIMTNFTGVVVIQSVQRRHRMNKCKSSPERKRIDTGEAQAKAEAIRLQVSLAVQRNRAVPNQTGILLQNIRGMFCKEYILHRFVELEPLSGSLRVWDHPDSHDDDGRHGSSGNWLAALRQYEAHCKEYSLLQLELVEYNEAWRNIWLHFHGGIIQLLTADSEPDFCKWRAILDLYRVPAMDRDTGTC